MVAPLGLILFPRDPEFLHAGLQGGALHAQAGSSAVDAGDDPAGFAECQEDVFAFDVLKGSSTSSLRRRDVQLRHGSEENGALGEDDGAFNEILKFPNVSRPVPALQSRE